MRVMWFTNVPLIKFHDGSGQTIQGSGTWMHSLLQALLAEQGFQLAVVSAAPSDPEYHVGIDGVDFFNIPQSRLLQSVGAFQRRRIRTAILNATSIIEQWKPDLIHVHGTEKFFGLVRSRGFTEIPTVVSMQGMIAESYKHARGTLSLWDCVRYLNYSDIRSSSTPLAIERKYRKQVPIEREILSNVDAVMGRTEWDRNYVRAINPSLHYLHVGEILRPEFYEASPWSVANSDPLRIFTTSSITPLKGLVTLLEAIGILARWGHKVRLRVAGVSDQQITNSGLGHNLTDKLEEHNIRKHVTFLGRLDSAALVQEMHQARCFVYPSLIDNSPNALCEAQMVGTPCAASYTGGIPSLVDDRSSGLLFTPASPPQIAAAVESIISDQQLAARIGENGRLQALQRHNPNTILKDLKSCYRWLLNSASDSQQSVA